MISPQRSVLRVGDLRVDSELGELRKDDGVTLKLEPTAMRLFMYLVEHAGRVVSVEELLDRVWPDVVVSPDSV
jgi:transcriptional activator of cad operon